MVLIVHPNKYMKNNFDFNFMCNIILYKIFDENINTTVQINYCNTITIVLCNSTTTAIVILAITAIVILAIVIVSQ